MSDRPLFDEQARRRLEQLTLVAARTRAGAYKGDRRSNRRGSSLEFADQRDYAPGDDLRRLDWNAYARLERPLTRLYEDEQDLAVHLLIDASASMGFPQPEAGEQPAVPRKFDLARLLIAALGLIALSAGDRLTVTVFGGGGERLAPVRGRAAAPRLLSFIEGLRPGGAVDVGAALGAYARRPERPGLCVLVSDLMGTFDLSAGLNALIGRGCEVGVLHVLSPDEVDPPLNGDLRLIDSETGAPLEASIDDGLRALYQRRLAAWRDALAAECRQRGAHFIPLVSDAVWERVVLFDLRRAGLVR
jgi:uncharacterized protein (DUF58 family)